MQNIKSGKEEIIYLLTKAIEKYKLETGQQIVQNTNRKNYESLAIVLSQISNQLPFKAEEWGTEGYSAGVNPQSPEYPHRKYDITGGQIKDALIGIVANPRPFLIDACYIYLYGMGRKAFKQHPIDENLVESLVQDTEKHQSELKKKFGAVERQNIARKKTIRIMALLMALMVIGVMALFWSNTRSKREWETIKKEMNILPYLPTAKEIDSVEGIWLCYTGSPQARISDASRYHKVVSNLVDIKYKDGYFVYDRYGASFNHIGYMQFESPGIVSVYSRIKSNSGNTESPRHSLLNLNSGRQYLPAISSSWNFDVGDKNTIIGIREIYIKLGKGGTIKEVINEIENASCQCKVIRWHQSNGQVKTFYLKNQLLDSLEITEIRPLINEKSILLSIPYDGLIISKDSAGTH
ncbi:MAG: hypothetical protein WCF67_03050 [Chitinophagaceae bacterium]